MDKILEFLAQFFDYLKPWVLVNTFERVVILRNGKFIKGLEPGLYFKIPFIDNYFSCNIMADTKEYGPLAITTADGKTITLGVVIEFEIADYIKFILENNDSITNLRDLTIAECSDLLEDINWVDIKKKTTKNALKRAVGEKVKTLGVTILDLKFTTKCESKVFRILSDKELIF